MKFTRMLLMMFASCLMMSGIGCARTEVIAYREGVDRGLSTVRAEHLEWAQAISTGVGLPDLSTLTPEERQTWLKARVRVHDEYELLVNESRAKDSQQSWLKIFGQ